MSQPPAALSREGRSRCWAARDAFFQCLNLAGVDQPPVGSRLGRGEGACANERGAYESECPASWVDYFNTRRMLEIRQRRTYEASERERDEKAAQQAAAGGRR